MTIRTKLITTGLIAASLVSGAAQAALQGRDLNGSAGSFEAYYDTVLDITWLADANYAQTSGYDADGAMTWAAANTWAANLSIVDAVNNITYDNWRLPTSNTCSGWNCTGSEMGHLYYSELGVTAGQSILTSTDPDLAKFTNLQANSIYWSATEYVGSINTTWYARRFSMFNGSQESSYKDNGFYALAVSPGDVAAVPEADTWAMLLAGLGLVGVAARRRVR